MAPALAAAPSASGAPSGATNPEVPTLSTDLLASPAEDSLLASADDLMPTADALPMRCLVISCRAESWLLLLLRALLEPVSLILLLLPLLARALIPDCFGAVRCRGGLGVTLGLPAGGVVSDPNWVRPSVSDIVGTPS